MTKLFLMLVVSFVIGTASAASAEPWPAHAWLIGWVSGVIAGAVMTRIFK